MDWEPPEAGGEETRSDGDVVPFPRDWLGPREELVPFGPSARRTEEHRALDDGGFSPLRAEDFWSESSAAIHGALEAPAATQDHRQVEPPASHGFSAGPPTAPAPTPPATRRRLNGMNARRAARRRGAAIAHLAATAARVSGSWTRRVPARARIVVRRRPLGSLDRRRLAPAAVVVSLTAGAAVAIPALSSPSPPQPSTSPSSPTVLSELVSPPPGLDFAHVANRVLAESHRDRAAHPRRSVRSHPGHSTPAAASVNLTVSSVRAAVTAPPRINTAVSSTGAVGAPSVAVAPADTSALGTAAESRNAGRPSSITGGSSNSTTDGTSGATSARSSVSAPAASPSGPAGPGAPFAPGHLG